MDERHRLLDVLATAQDRGLIGPGPLSSHLDHSHAWATALAPRPSTFLDLGSGGGVPGLPFLLEWPDASATMLDSRRRSTEWVIEAAERMGWTGRVSTIGEHAEIGGRDPELRETFPLVVARGFGGPAVTAECASGFVEPGGCLSVSEPPGGDGRRWPEEGLATLGLRLVETRVVGEGSFVILEKVRPLDERWPRRVGKPGRRPLW